MLEMCAATELSSAAASAPVVLHGAASLASYGVAQMLMLPFTPAATAAGNSTAPVDAVTQKGDSDAAQAAACSHKLGLPTSRAVPLLGAYTVAAASMTTCTARDQSVGTARTGRLSVGMCSRPALCSKMPRMHTDHSSRLTRTTRTRT